MIGLKLPAKAGLWALIGLTFIVAVFAAAPTALAAPSAAHVDHHISAAGEPDHLSAVDHGHISLAAFNCAPDELGDTLLHRMRFSLLALGLIFAVGLLWRLSPRHPVLVGRGPPCAPEVVSHGRNILARLCISRR
jgi:MFS superfamily sulfate permease-like transporter